MGTSCTLSPLLVYHTNEDKNPKPLTLHSPRQRLGDTCPRSLPPAAPHEHQDGRRGGAKTLCPEVGRAPKLRAGRANSPLRRAGSRRSPQFPRGLPTGPAPEPPTPRNGNATRTRWGAGDATTGRPSHPISPGGAPAPTAAIYLLQPRAPSSGRGVQASLRSQLGASPACLSLSLSTSFSRARPCKPGARRPEDTPGAAARHGG